jgi:hypothetical protein
MLSLMPLLILKAATGSGYIVITFGFITVAKQFPVLTISFTV